LIGKLITVKNCLDPNRLITYVYSMRFTEDGPDFPQKLLDEVLLGDVVLLCGAGISMPAGLPSFKGLTDRLFQSLSEEKTPSEQISYKSARYEECIGSLYSRLTNYQEIVQNIETIFSDMCSKKLDAHKSITRISKDRHNRSCIVTTNFDTVLERALLSEDANKTIHSYSGQEAPMPGASDFHGIIHLHGRLECNVTNLTRTPLVLTSSDYGEAYLRSGWASRFLFDLVRCKTLLLVGYSAGDATVRYILNVLHADRDRFSDIRNVFALVSDDGNEEKAVAQWEAISVEAITYKNHRSAKHKRLWEALSQLADYAELPDVWRHNIVENALSQPLNSLPKFKIEQCLLALGSDSSLWDTASKHIVDSAWIESLSSDAATPSETRAWLLAHWASLNWDKRYVFETVLEKAVGLGEKFSDRLEVQLERNRPTSPLWLKAWRLLAHYVRKPGLNHYSDYLSHLRLANDQAIELDIIDALKTITPSLNISVYPDYRRSYLKAEGFENKLSDICQFEVSLNLQTEGDYPNDFFAYAQIETGRAERLLNLATQALETALMEAVDVEIIIDDDDSTIWSVPSVSRHDQNKYHHDFLHLIRLIADVFDDLASKSPDLARQVYARWVDNKFVLFKRLCLHALKHDMFSGDQALEFVLKLKTSDLSNTKRELMMLLQVKSGTASPQLRAAVISKIVNETKLLYPDRPDDDESGLPQGWRQRARNRMAWRLLKSMVMAEAQEAIEPLNELIQIDTVLSEDIKDQDYFDIYSSGAYRSALGRTDELVEARPEVRLDLISTYAASPEFDAGENWPAYCRQDPLGAFESLKIGDETPDIAKAWADWMWSLNTPDQSTDSEAGKILGEAAQASFQHLKYFSDDFINKTGPALVSGFNYAKGLEKDDHRYWWDRLWLSCERTGKAEYVNNDALTSAINSPSGRLTEGLLHIIEGDKNAETIDASDLQRLRTVIIAQGEAGFMARVICSRFPGFVESVDQEAFTKLVSYLKSEDEEGRALRKTLLIWSAPLNAKITVALLDTLLMGANEAIEDPSGNFSEQAAAKFLAPILNSIENPNTDWGINSDKLRNCLKQSSALLISISQLLARWLEHPGHNNKAELWERLYKPAFKAIWPRDKKHKDEKLNLHLARFAIAAQSAFPDALNTVEHYIGKATERWTQALFSEKNGYDSCANHPEEVVRLLYRLYGEAENRSVVNLGKSLDKITAANPYYVRDKRVQTLKRKSITY
jgi:hypothetical protein